MHLFFPWLALQILKRLSLAELGNLCLTSGLLMSGDLQEY